MADEERRTIKIFISAGEASGDLHGSYLARALKTLAPNLRLTCMGGRFLEEAGAEVLVDYRRLSVVGLSEVVAHLRVIWQAWRTIASHLSRNPPDTIVLIDFPDFNFLLARLAKRRGIRVFYYISPQVWAWRSGRVRTIRRLVDTMAVILPFESAFYERHRMKVRFVGHPLLDVLAEIPPIDQVKQRYRNTDAGRLIGVLPGSRQSEIRSLLHILLESAEILRNRLPDVSFIIAVAPSLNEAFFEEALAGRDLPVRLVRGDTYGVIRACDLLLTVSGTATLEAAVLGTPMIITNRVSDLSYHLGRRLIKVNYIGLPNLIAGRRIVPEFVQQNARAELIAGEALNLLEHPERLYEQRRELGLIKTSLGEPGVALRVARLVLENVR
jgi:lipid-A-disaccharide synthase